MKIWLKKNILFFENGENIFVTKDMIVKFSLKGREEIDRNELKALLHFRIMITAYKLLQKRDYFTQEMRLKLNEKYRFPNIIEEVVEILKEKSYLNDREAAISYARTHSNYGKNKLKYIFQRMNLDSDIINEILFETEEDELENIKSLWSKLGNKSKDKKIASLLRKGFSYRDIQKVLSLMEEEE